MKKVLIVDNHPLYRDYLKQKLSAEQLEVTISQQNRDAFTKTISLLPNLILLDIEDDSGSEIDFLERKLSDQNTARIPVIVTGPEIERTNIASMAKYGVIKYFAKPIQFDVYFEAISHTLQVPLPIDLTPSLLDVHNNCNIIFIELAQGLNREKLALLQYKITEIIEKENIESPRIIIMLTNLELSFVDGYNLEFLIDNILALPHVHTKSITILSSSPYLRDFIDGHSTYSGIETSPNLPKVLNSLIDTTLSSSISDLITNKILLPSNIAAKDTTSVETRFHADINPDAPVSSNKNGNVLNVAIIDSNTQDLVLTKTVFESVSATCSAFSTGKEFLESFKQGKYNLIVLDVMMEDNSGFDVLAEITSSLDAPPVVVYSQSLDKTVVVKVLSSGAKTYLVKPQKPNVLIQKCLAQLRRENNDEHTHRG